MTKQLFLSVLLFVLINCVLNVTAVDVMKVPSYYKLSWSEKQCKKAPCPQYTIESLNGKQDSESILNVNVQAGIPTKYILKNESNSVIVYGFTQKNSKYPKVNDLMVSKVFKALPLGDKVRGTDKFYILADNGIRCITTPCFSIDAVELNINSKVAISDFKHPFGKNVNQFDSVWFGSRVFKFKSTDKTSILQGSIVNGVLVASNAYINLPDPSSNCPELPLLDCVTGTSTTFSRDENRCLSEPKCTKLGFCTLSIPICQKGYNLVSFKSTEANGCPKYYCDPHFVKKTY